MGLLALAAVAAVFSAQRVLAARAVMRAGDRPAAGLGARGRGRPSRADEPPTASVTAAERRGAGGLS